MSATTSAQPVRHSPTGRTLLPPEGERPPTPSFQILSQLAAAEYEVAHPTITSITSTASTTAGTATPAPSGSSSAGAPQGPGPTAMFQQDFGQARVLIDQQQHPHQGEHGPPQQQQQPVFFYPPQPGTDPSTAAATFVYHPMVVAMSSHGAVTGPGAHAGLPLIQTVPMGEAAAGKGGSRKRGAGAEPSGSSGKASKRGRHASSAPRITNVEETLEQWLRTHYTHSPGRSVMRSSVYEHFVSGPDCKDKPTNATFGKAVKKVFPQVQARRLGCRGNSKYHYDGLCPLAKGPTTAARNAVPVPVRPGDLPVTTASASAGDLSIAAAADARAGNPPVMVIPPGLSRAPLRSFTASEVADEPDTEGSRRVRDSAPAALRAVFEQFYAAMLDLVKRGDASQVLDHRRKFFKEIPIELYQLLYSATVCQYVKHWEQSFFQDLLLHLVPCLTTHSRGPHPVEAKKLVAELHEDTLKIVEQLGMPQPLVAALVAASEFLVGQMHRCVGVYSAALEAKFLLTEPQVRTMIKDLGHVQPHWSSPCISGDPCSSQRMLRELSCCLKQADVEVLVDWVVHLLSKSGRAQGESKPEPERRAAIQLAVAEWNLFSCAVLQDLAMAQSSSLKTIGAVLRFLHGMLLYCADVMMTHPELPVFARLAAKPPSLGGLAEEDAAASALTSLRQRDVPGPGQSPRQQPAEK